MRIEIIIIIIILVLHLLISYGILIYANTHKRYPWSGVAWKWAVVLTNALLILFGIITIIFYIRYA